MFFLLVVSSIGTLSFSEDSNTTEKNKLLEDLKFYCTTPIGFNEVKFDYYKKQLLKQDSDEYTKEYLISNSEELITIPNTPLITGLSNGPMDSAWPMQSHDLHHTGRSPYSTADNPYDEKWRFGCGWIECGVVIDNNEVLYFEDFAGYIYAIYQNGTLKWRFKTDNIILGSTPAIDEDGTIYVGSWDTVLYALNPNGTLKWESPGTGGSIACSPAIGEDGTIYIGNYGSKIVAINPNGTIKWYYNTDDDITSDPAIADDGTIYIGSLDSYLYALYPNGTLRWRFKTGDRIYGSPSIADDGTVYIGSSWDSYLYAIYPNNGTLKWKYGGAGTPNNPSIGSDGTIYASYLYHLLALYPNGTLKWDFYIGNNRFIGKSAPAISADGTIYFGIHLGTPGNSDGGEIIALNPDGTERWRKKIAQKWVESSPSIAEDGTVYIGSTNNIDTGYLYAFGVKDLEADANGPYYSLINDPIQFTGSSSGGYYPHSYHWDFGDTQTSEEQNPMHTYTNAGNYTVTFTVTDNTSNTTNDTTWAWIQETNTPPDKPIINGPINGNVKTSYPYVVSASDPDESNIWYYIDWGDNTNTGWIGPYDSDLEITCSHSWDEKGTYIIKVKAKDPYNSESLETTLEVTMPRNKALYYSSFFIRFLERFPILQKILSFSLLN
jgi:outer membrane protein assembly factor BamB